MVKTPPDVEDREKSPTNEELPPLDRKWGVFQKYLVLWAFPLLKNAHKEEINPETIPEISKCLTLEVLLSDYNKYKSKLETNKVVTIFRHQFFYRWVLAGIYYLSWCTVTGCFPFILEQLVRFWQHEEISASSGYMYAAFLFPLFFIYVFSINAKFTELVLNGDSMRRLLMKLLHQKSLKIHPSANFNTGKVTSLMSNDVDRIYEGTIYLHYLWAAVLFILIISALMISRLGWAAVVGFGSLILMVFLQAALSKCYQRHKRFIFQATDVRIELMANVLHGIKIVKMYAWEDALDAKIASERIKELTALKRALYIQSTMSTLQFVYPGVCACVTTVSYALLGQEVTLEVAIFVIACIAILKFPIWIIPMAFGYLVEALISFERIQDFLELEETSESSLDTSDMKGNVVLKSASFSWERENPKFILQDLNLSVNQGELVAVIGEVGCGKSSLLLSLLDQMHLLNGKKIMNNKNTVGYMDQTNLLLSLTLKDNIRFGKSIETGFYDDIIRASALETDLNIFPQRDLTQVGERGVTLSGGQKQRACFARCLARKSEADIFLLDDPFSAVDMDVGMQMFSRGVMTLLKGKTRIIAMSSHLHLLHKFDRIVVMEKGKIKLIGTYEEILPEIEVLQSLLQRSTEDGEESPKNIPTGRKRGDKISQKKPRGQISWEVLKLYYDSSLGGYGTLAIFVIIFLYVFCQIMHVCVDIYLTWWAYPSNPSVPSFLNNRSSTFWLVSYSSFAILDIVFTLFRCFVCTYMCLMASKAIHEKALAAIFNAPISYFQAKPLGSILNRFSTDMNKIDSRFSSDLYSLFDHIAQCLAVLILGCIVTPWWLLILPPLTVVIYWFGSRFRGGSRSLTRSLNESRSPIFSLFDDCLALRSTIHAFKNADHFNEKADDLISLHGRIHIAQRFAERWATIYFMIMSYFLTAALAVLGCLLKEQDVNIDPSLLSLTVIYTMQAASMLALGIRYLVMVDAGFVSVERMLSMVEIGQESGRKSLLSDPDLATWPSNGKISIRDLTFQYKPTLPLVLKSISFDVKSGERIGICGRTGAGKSSVFVCFLQLFRCKTPSSIKIDGVEITDIGLETLRKSISTIPQDYVMFPGSIRYNLDPFSNHSDDEIWTTLKQIHLFDFVKSHEEGINFHLKANGGNLSCGQRQLLCIGRALLRNCKILLLDEATSSVDPATDKLIQETIRTCFSQCTIFTVAHRLETIVDYDRILVLDHGEIAEFDTPENLLKNRSSAFAKMYGSESHV